ncbi:uncharacterized protein LOC100576093 [Apis mellifera]|uniref:Uncharacterized protein LOC100576093 n=1 Tax=Apis mellifera TaxID=7460 RepID=A0A7M7GJP5_APIME|nr:uncharacterized protein LOC100576093 [Apis mellifera]|eukprot:XP_006558247.3 uncharacterized protein LOC100576093 [Apis mellifera]
MRMKVFIIIFFLLILTSNGISFGRKRSAKCRKDSEKTLSKNDENLTVDYYYNCDPTEFGIVQKISYLRSCSTCDTIEINFSSACIRCGMCLAIADKINQTLLDVHEVLPNACFNDTEIELLLRTICDHSFQYYGLHEVNGRRYISDKLPGSVIVSTTADGLWGKRLSDLCHYYLDEIGEISLYKQWQHWYDDDEKNDDLYSIMCRNIHGLLRDCKSMENIEKYEYPCKSFNAKMKISATFERYGYRS